MPDDGLNSFVDNELGGPDRSMPPPSPFQRFGLALSLSPRAFAGAPRAADWLIPLLIVVAMQLVSAVLIQDLILDAARTEMVERWESRPESAPEQMDEAWEIARKGIQITTLGAPVVMVPIACLLASAIFLLVLNFGLGATARFGSLWFVSCLAWAPKAIETILFTVLAKARGSIDIAFGPAALISGDTGLVKSLLGILDLFDFWMIGIHFVGLATLLAIPKRQARTAVVVLWIVYWGARIVMAVVGEKFRG